MNNPISELLAFSNRKRIKTLENQGSGGKDAESIRTKSVNIEDFTGQDGKVMSYNETEDEFVLIPIPSDTKDAVSILTKPITVEDFTGKDGCVIAYDENAGEFYLKADETGGGDGGGLKGTNFVYGVLDMPLFEITTIAKPV